MDTLIIESKWHKANDKFAMTYEQLEYIYSLMNDENLQGWRFGSKTNAMRSLTKSDASEIISTLKTGGKVIIK